MNLYGVLFWMMLGIVKPQIVIFSGADYFGERYYFTEEGLRYILDSFLDCAKVKGAKRAFDSLMVDDFSKCYSDIVAEVRRKQPTLEKESYNVPTLGLYQVQLSRVLEEIYKRFVTAIHGSSVEAVDTF